MMLEYLKLPAEAKAIEVAVRRVMGDPANRTPDLGGTMTTGEVTAKVIAALG
jgi:isocitrate/isopropylmalate dehydrogenase